VPSPLSPTGCRSSACRSSRCGDRLVDPAGSALVEARAGSDDLTRIVYDGLYHELLNEPERNRVLGDVAGWIDARVSQPTLAQP
jgi:hypothetical protein